MLNHLPFACEASALATEPPGPVVVEMTRMHIYTNTLGSVPTQCFLLSKYFTPTLFFFLSVFHFIFCLSPFFPFVLLTSPFFFPLDSFPFFFYFPSFLFLCLLFTSYVRPIICNLRPLLNMEGHIVLALRKLI